MYKRFREKCSAEAPKRDLHFEQFYWRSTAANSAMNNNGNNNGMSHDKWWRLVDTFNNKIPVPLLPQKQRRGWQTIRLFVSSTFKDMNDEREHLVKHIFPELRLWCEERKLRLIECDLRWGIPKDADQTDTLNICLSEIDRCYEDNTFPYFLSILSERYGWVPDEDTMPDDIRQRYKWLAGMSVTSLEVCTGAYWIQNPNALFMFRSPDFLKAIMSSKIQNVFDETKNMEYKESLAALKGKIRERFGGYNQVHEYSCQYEHDRETGHDKITGLEEFGQVVLDHFKQRIAAQYPDISDSMMMSPQQQQRLEHTTFMLQRSEVVYGRDAIVYQMEHYVKALNAAPRPLVLVGYPGTGKSSLIALAARIFSSDKSPIQCQCFHHFVGATPGSTNLYRLLTRVWLELLPDGDQPPTDLNELKFSMDTVLKKASGALPASSRLLIFIDALNQMEEEGGALDLAWLPRDLPANVRIIVSTLEGRCLDALRSAARKPTESPTEILVSPLDHDTRKKVASKILLDYGKQLDNDQLEVLVSKADAGRPLWLSVACEELRVFGDFRRLDEKIEDLSCELIGLLEQVLLRTVKDNGGDLVIATLCLIQVSKLGLLETELLELLAMTPTLPGSGSQHAANSGDDVSGGVEALASLPMAQWAKVYVGLRSFFRPTGSAGEGRIDFYHRTISKAVRQLYLKSETDLMWWHERLAAYFEHCRDIQRQADELPYHLEKLGARERLEACLLRKDIFDELYTDDHKLQLLAYWRFASSYEAAAKGYVNLLFTYLKSMGYAKEMQAPEDPEDPDAPMETLVLTNLDEALPTIVKFAQCIIDVGQYNTALFVLTQLVEQIEKTCGKDSQLLCDPILTIIKLCQMQAMTARYSTHPVYQKAKDTAEFYTERCIELHLKYYDALDLKLGLAYMACAFFRNHLIDSAMPIFEACDYKQGLAEIYYRIGKRNQNNPDIDYAIDYFERGLALCKIHFGLYHMKTARCYDLYGMFYWNKWMSNKDRGDWLDACLPYYEKQLEITEVILGPNHPNTIRSRAEVIEVLQTMDRHEEAKKYELLQPPGTDA